MNGPELSVVCGECGSEVSPYVTECPYCGARVRKRAPKLELRDDGLAPSEPRMLSPRRTRRIPRPALPALRSDRPWATIVTIALSALGLLVGVAADLSASQLGAIDGPVGGEWWRYLVAPFVYTQVGYLFVCCLGIAIFGAAVERRLGTLATAALILACGALGMLAADGVGGLIGSGGSVVAAGGNGVALGLLAAWAPLRAAEVKSMPGEYADVIGAAVAAAVLVLLSVVVAPASIVAGLAGALVGGLSGIAGARSRRGAHG